MGAVVIALSLELDQAVRLIALDRGGIVDEYLSVPEFYGALPPGRRDRARGEPDRPRPAHRRRPGGGEGRGAHRAERSRAAASPRAPRRDRAVLGLEGATTASR